ncbi:MAG: preprotein translocase subunit SecY [Candidatus Synechococcus spongiarum 15L]|uniref:Protein translocase subunit SecY n=3 Tax=Candidatus Synechococcus spongiarum TaxID=431041 RepID=A0A1T1C9U8_9SYNE|nr:preprotein translocase subunit SecY [Candidatus Synechococcus spongiarum]KKZ13835.1 MAG: preprotein translocase subunit SecY [Candidatus Synechococcus spongiarum 15L]MCY4360480.1 preprotein translocase subunit SecY [Cyanobacteria bacterium MAG APA_bin_95]OOV25409.1 preprotein translocase subunit SecY [Candidatus Synechococcus spongiarum LMB bulk15M]OOV35803.1 preprotein translocase subunit SecY [Candidatus Synechococcus spongiarum LMB bulk10D]OOV36376.1 preprotein translocase subunit SecY [
MTLSQGRAPTTGETLTQIVTAPDLRSRVLITLGLLLLIRVGAYIWIPGLDVSQLQNQLSGGQLIGLLSIFTGGAPGGVFSLGILPFINASIIMQLLTAALPSLETLQKDEGEAGRRKLAQITRYVALGWGSLQAVIFSLYLRGFANGELEGAVFVVSTSLALTTGAMVVMWISEIITEKGIGNGASLVIFVNITASLPNTLQNIIREAQTGKIFPIVVTVAVALSMVVAIVAVQEGSRRIPIVSARRQIGFVAVLPERQSYLPLKLISGGVMPIIFASAMLFLPATLANFTSNAALVNLATWLSPSYTVPGLPLSTGWVYGLTYFFLIFGFSFFYASLVVNPTDMALNLKRQGVAVPGIRPGSATANYLSGVINRLTLIGGSFLGLIAIIPNVVYSFTGTGVLQGLGATSLLILVGVAIETAKQLQTNVISQRYEGMVRQ